MINTLKNKNFIIISTLAVAFFFIYSYFSFNHNLKFNSPDESANYFFISQFVQNSTFQYEEPLNEIADSIIHPRNTIVSGANIIPFSFLGLYFILGLFGKIFGMGVIFFIIPFFSSITCIFFYLLVREIFSEKVAFFSSVLLFIFPAFWFLSSRPMHHNALFVSLFIISFYFLIKIIKENKLPYYVLFGVFIALALMVRTSEIIWITALVLIWLIFYRKSINIKYLAISVLAFIIILTPLLYLNNQIYGEVFTAGYLEGGSSVQQKAAESSTFIKILKKPAKILFPSGFNVDKLYETVSKYIVQIFYPFFILWTLGIIIFFKKYKKRTRDQKIYFWTFIIISIYLIFYYGSGSFFGARGSEIYTIDSSLIRYWLPIYVLSIPFIVFAILQIVKIIKNKNLKLISAGLAVLFLTIFSFNLVYFESEAGLIKIRSNTDLYIDIEKEVINSTEDDSVIITSFADKFLFPKRKVIGLNGSLEDSLNSEKRWNAILNLIDKTSIYYFTIYGVDVNELNYRLKEKGLRIIPRQVIMDIGSLYRIEKLN